MVTKDDIIKKLEADLFALETDLDYKEKEIRELEEELKYITNVIKNNANPEFKEFKDLLLEDLKTMKIHRKEHRFESFESQD